MQLNHFKKHTIALATLALALGAATFGSFAIAADAGETTTTTRTLSAAELESLYGGTKFAPTPTGAAGSGAYNATQIQQDCFERAKASGQQTSDVTGQMVNSNQALMDLAKKPVPVSQEKTSGGSSENSPFSCVKETKKEFDEMLTDLLGADAGFLNSLASLFGFGTQDASKSLCGAIRENISETFGFSCSSISPALRGSVGCGANVKITQNGITGTVKLGDSTLRGTVNPNQQTVTGTGAFSQPATSALGTASTAPQTTINQRMLCAFNPANCK